MKFDLTLIELEIDRRYNIPGAQDPIATKEP